MKSLSSLPLLVLLFGVSLPVSSQAQIRYGLKAGVQITHADVQYAIPPTSTQGALGFLIAGLGEYEATKNIMLSAGLQASRLGYTVEFSDPIDYFKETRHYSLYYVHMPVMARIQHRGLSGGLGLFTGVALAGREKLVSDFGQTPREENNSIQFGQQEQHDLQRFDWGPLAELGYSFRNFRVAGHYWLGLANTLPEYYRTPDQHIRTRAIGASLTYYFGEGE